MKKQFAHVDEYIESQDVRWLDRMNQIRQVVVQNAPDAEECIAYGMPAYKWHNKPLVYWGCFPKHIGFYATPSGHERFAAQLSAYKQGKGSVQFPHNQPLPLQLIAEMVKFRVEESNQTAKNNH